MKRSILATLLILPSLSACSGLGQSKSGVLPQGASVPLGPDAAAREATSDAARSLAAPFVAGPSYRLYVADAGDNSITVYHANASGNTAPIATIMGSNTQLDSPSQLSEDANGNLYVANSGTSSILVFAHGANGNVAPVQAISGPQTGLSAGLGTATVDQATGKIFAVAFVADEKGGSELLRFPLNANGDEAPLATSPCCYSAFELTSNSTGKKFVYASGGICCSSFTEGVYSVEKFPNAAHPSRRPHIFNFGPSGVVDDPTTKTFLVTGYDGVTQGIFRFQEDTVGTGTFDTVAFGGHSAPAPSPTPFYDPAVVSVITSDTCGGQLALGYDRNIYVAHNTVYPRCAADAVYIYEHDASGNATPLRVLTGSATLLDEPNGIYVGK